MFEEGVLVEGVALLGPSRWARFTGICGLWFWGGFCVLFGCFAKVRRIELIVGNIELIVGGMCS